MKTAPATLASTTPAMPRFSTRSPSSGSGQISPLMAVRVRLQCWPRQRAIGHITSLEGSERGVGVGLLQRQRRVIAVDGGGKLDLLGVQALQVPRETDRVEETELVVDAEALHHLTTDLEQRERVARPTD